MKPGRTPRALATAGNAFTANGPPGGELPHGGGARRDKDGGKERADGGRGFDFTGGHAHSQWVNDNERKVVRIAILRVAEVEVTSAVTPAQLAANLDPKPAPKQSRSQGRRMPGFGSCPLWRRHHLQKAHRLSA